MFYGVPFGKIQRLMAAVTPDVIGHYPLSSSLTLRLQALHRRYPLEALDVCERLVRQPLLYSEGGMGDVEAGEQLAAFMRFSVDYLARESHVNTHGSLVGLGPLASHLHAVEPGNFVLAALLRDGIIHDLCTPTDDETDDDMHVRLLHVLSHLFHRRPLHPCAFGDHRVTESYSNVVLDGLPYHLAESVRAHNARALSVITAYIRSAAKRLPRNATAALPISNVPFPVENGGDAVTGGLVDALLAEAVPFAARSPFAALSGGGDIFGSAEEISSSVVDGISFEPAAAPVTEPVRLHVNATAQVLNSFVLDYYKHGQRRVIIEANGLNASEFWNGVNDFGNTIR